MGREREKKTKMNSPMYKVSWKYNIAPESNISGFLPRLSLFSSCEFRLFGTLVLRFEIGVWFQSRLDSQTRSSSASFALSIRLVSSGCSSYFQNNKKYLYKEVRKKEQDRRTV